MIKPIIFKSNLPIDQILYNFRIQVHDKNEILSSLDEDWLKEDFFMGEQINPTSFWFYKKHRSDDRDSLGLPLFTTPIKAVVKLEQIAHRTVVRCDFKYTVWGYILAILALICLCLACFLFVQFIKYTSLIYFCSFVFSATFFLLSFIGFCSPRNCRCLIDKLKEIMGENIDNDSF